MAEELARTLPLAGHRIAACLHVTTETANLCRAPAAGGAELALCASNALSTKDDVAAAIAAELGAAVFAIHGADRDTFARQLDGALVTRPTLVVDCAHALPGKARFRLNVYFQRDSVGAAFRLIPQEIKPLEALGIPAQVSGLAR